MLSAEDASEPGRYSTARAPYQREMLDACSDPLVQDVIFMTSAQVGKTLIAKAIIGFFIDQDPAPLLIVQPTVDMAETFSKDRLAPMLRDTPALRGRIADPRSRDSGNTILHKRFPGGHLTMVGANAPAGLASRPIRVVIFDEVDRYPASAGTEGDPVTLGKARSKTFYNRKHIHASTPGDKSTSRINPLFESSDQRHYFVPCPHCGEMQRLRWAQVKFTDNDPETAHYECEAVACGLPWSDGQRIEALSAGEWRATHPGRKVRGYHLNELYSPFRLVSNVVTDFLSAKTSPETLKTWTNTSLGEVWDDTGGEDRNPEGLAARCEQYDCSDSTGVPDGVVWVDCGVDTQDDRLELEFVGWGIGEETWGLDYVVLEGATDGPEVWRRLADELDRMFVRQDGARLPVSLMAIDSAGHRTRQVMDFCAKHRRAKPCVGRSDTIGKGGERPPVRRPAKAKGEKRKPWVIGVDGLKKTLIQSRLLVEVPGPKYCHFPATYDATYFDQLTAEVPVTKWKAGVAYTTWDAGKRRNEALDCRVLAMAGFHMERPNFEALRTRLLAEAAARRAMTELPKPKPRQLRRAVSNYMRS